MSNYTAEDFRTAEFWEKMILEGKAPWQQDWKPGHPGSILPYNAISGRTYRGYNPFLLLAMQDEKGYTSNCWMTYKQAAALGGQVRKGEKSTAINFYMPTTYIKEQADGSKVETEGAVRKVAFVFNAQQIDGLPDLTPAVLLSPEERHAECEHLMSQSEAPIFYDGGDRAYYRPSSDSIHLPARESFKSMEGLYAVALHEMGHSTGHEKRLNRNLFGPFGSEQYAFEELCAEISSCLMSSRLGIEHDPSNHVAYVQSWIKAIKTDPRAIQKACAQAERICDYLGVVERHREPMKTLDQEREQQQEPAPESTKPQPQRGKETSQAQPVAAKAPIDHELDALWAEVVAKGKALAECYGLAIDYDIGDGWGYQGHPNVEPEGKGGFILKDDVYKHLGLTYGHQLDPSAKRQRGASKGPSRPKQRAQVQEAEMSR